MIGDLRVIAHRLRGEVAGDQVLAPGPGHSPKDRSLSVKLESAVPDGFVVFSHAGDDPIQCRDYVREALGLPKWAPNSSRQTNVEFIYRDRDGRPYLRVTRTADKKFWQHRWDGHAWVKGAPRPKVPYRLPELLAAPADAPVFVCEGEKNTDAVRRLGFVATTNSEGAGKWTDDLDAYLSGRVCYVLEDNDEPGRKHVAKVARHLGPVAAEVRIVRLPGLAEVGDDVGDWIEAGGDAATLLGLCQAAPRHDAEAEEREPTRQPRFQSENDTRPVITIRAGEIKDAVDAAEAALITRGGLYQRSNLIVFLGEAPVITADKREVGAQRIFERGEHALAEDLAEAACFMKFDGRAEDFVVVNPPTWVVKTLQQRTGRLRFPVLTGIINAPTLRPDGSLISAAGYDRETGLFFDPRGTTFPSIPAKPTRDLAMKAVALLDGLIAKFPFVTEADKSVALSGMLTACIRQSLRTAPLHAFTAPVAGSGKSKLVDIASVISTGREAGVIAQGKTEEEMEKRLGSLFRAGDQMISIDNCEAPLGGEFLCQVLTQTAVRVRILGLSEAPEFSTRTFVTATGNGLSVIGDMTRRALISQLDPRVERPELREFDFEPVTKALADRARYVAAALVVLLAYRAAGSPAMVSPLGSFEEWSDLVRSALVWLCRADPVGTMERTRASDPRLEELSSVLTQWRKVVGTDRISTSRLVERATKRTETYGGVEFINPDFRDALLAVAGHGGAINTRRLGRWLASHAKRIVGGCWIEQEGFVDGLMTWRLAAATVY